MAEKSMYIDWSMQANRKELDVKYEQTRQRWGRSEILLALQECYPGDERIPMLKKVPISVLHEELLTKTQRGYRVDAERFRELTPEDIEAMKK